MQIAISNLFIANEKIWEKFQIKPAVFQGMLK